MSARLLWLRGRSPPWPGLLEAWGSDGQVATDVDVTSMRDVRSAVMAARPDAVMYAGWRDEVAVEGDPSAAFMHIAEATIGVAAAAMELGARAILVSHPAVFGGPARAFSEADEPRPETTLGEAFQKAEVFLRRAVRDRALIVRAGPVLNTGLGPERAELDAVRAIPDRCISPISDTALGTALVRLLEGEAQGIVHLFGPTLRRSELVEALASALTGGAQAPALRVGPRDEGSWVLSSTRAAGNEPMEWDSVLPSAHSPMPVSAEPPRVQTLWQGPLRHGETSLGRGAYIVRLDVGRRWTMTAPGSAVLVTRGKVVVELDADTDQVLREGQKLDVAGFQSPRVVALDASELLVWTQNGA